MKKSFKFGWWSLLLLAVLLFTAVWGAEYSSTAKVKPTPKPDPRIFLSPNAFSQLPKEIIDYLTKNHYTIPQVYWNRHRNNAIHGQFYRKEQYDWAVIASKNGFSRIIIFKNGSTRSLEI